MKFPETELALKAPKRMDDTLQSILTDRSTPPRDRATRAAFHLVNTLFADSGLTPPDPVELIEALNARPAIPEMTGPHGTLSEAEWHVRMVQDTTITG